MREALRHRGFRLLFAAQCASFVGDAIFFIALAFAVFEVGGTAAALGAVLSTGSLVMVGSFLASGVWADRLPRVRLMIASDLARIVTQGVMATMLLTGTASVLWLMVLNCLYSFASAFFMPARTGLTPQLLAPEHLMAGNGLIATAENVMWMAGWAFGGLLVATIGTGWAIAIDAATFGVSALLLGAIGAMPAASEPEERQPFLRELADGWREVASRRWLWLVILGATFYLMVYEAPMQVAGPLAMERDYDGSASWGIALSGLGAGAVIGAVLAASGRLRRPFFTSLVLWFANVATPLLLLTDAPLAAIWACNVVVGTAFGLMDTVWHSTLQHRIPADKLSRVSAWDWMGAMAGMPLGFALAGGLIEAIGLDTTLIGMSVATGLMVCAFLIDPEVRKLGEDLPRDRHVGQNVEP